MAFCTFGTKLGYFWNRLKLDKYFGIKILTTFDKIIAFPYIFLSKASANGRGFYKCNVFSHCQGLMNLAINKITLTTWGITNDPASINNHMSRVGWNHLFITKLHWCNRWNLVMEKLFHLTLYNGCNYLSMLEVKLMPVGKRGLWGYRMHCCLHLASGGDVSGMMTSSNNFSSLLSLCEGNPPVIDGFPSQRQMTRSFDVSFDLRLNKQLSKRSRGWWFETPSCSLWRHCNAPRRGRCVWHWSRFYAGIHVLGLCPSASQACFRSKPISESMITVHGHICASPRLNVIIYTGAVWHKDLRKLSVWQIITIQNKGQKKPIEIIYIYIHRRRWTRPQNNLLCLTGLNWNE